MLSIILSTMLVVASLVVFILVWGWWSNGYFERKGVKSTKAYIPILGHLLPTMLRRIHVTDLLKQMYDTFPDQRYVGMIQIGKPVIILRDVELIKQIAIKDFDHFMDHGLASFEEDADLVFGRSLFSLKGQKWRDMRATLSPAFTSSKMRGMFQFMVDCGEQMTRYFTDQMESPENKVRGLVEVEMKDAFTRYANDVIATCAFGLEVNSFTHKTNEFYTMGIRSSNFGGKTIFKFFFIFYFPQLAKMLGIKIFNEEMSNFYRHIIWDTIKDREERGIVRKDMIQLLMEAKKGTLKYESNDDGKEEGFASVEECAEGKATVKRTLTDDDIVAQAILFFVSGFDTTSVLLCFITHELAINPDIQKRLQDEIDEVAVSTDGMLTYDCLHKMKYLDMVVSETLRKWSPFVIADRKCIKPYTLPVPGEDGKEFEMEYGFGIWIPIYAVHHDSRYFPDPEKFDPERFSDENKHNIIPFSYIPFGVGPRNCIGSRFVLMEAKGILFHLLCKFNFVTTAKTQNPIKKKLDSYNLISERGFWIGLKPRNII